MRHEQVAQAISRPAFGYCPIHVGSDINNRKAFGGFNLEFDHILEFTLEQSIIPP
jgi:hypothetical protein